MEQKINEIIEAIPSMTNPELLRLITPLIQEAAKRGNELQKAIPHNITKVERANIHTLIAIGNTFNKDN